MRLHHHLTQFVSWLVWLRCRVAHRPWCIDYHGRWDTVHWCYRCGFKWTERR